MSMSESAAAMPNSRSSSFDLEGIQNQELRLCYSCGSNGHISSHCPMGRLCLNCKSPDHLSHQCPHPSTGNDIRLCYGCGEKGHILKNCPDANANNNNTDSAGVGLGKRGMKNNSNIAKNKGRGGNSGNANSRCFRCGNTGHRQRDCNQPKPRANQHHHQMQHHGGNNCDKKNRRIANMHHGKQSIGYNNINLSGGNKNLYEHQHRAHSHNHGQQHNQVYPPTEYVSVAASGGEFVPNRVSAFSNSNVNVVDSSPGYVVPVVPMYPVYGANNAWGGNHAQQHVVSVPELQYSGGHVWSDIVVGNGLNLNPSPSNVAGEAVVKCYNCDEFGHLSRDCKKPRACFLCGESSHVARQCKYTQLAREATTTTGELEEEKQLVAENADSQAVIGDNISIDASEGSNSVDDAENLKKKDNRKTSCLNCSQPGHRLKSCPHGRRCFLCAKTGHVARECPMAEAVKRNFSSMKETEKTDIQQHPNYHNHIQPRGFLPISGVHAHAENHNSVNMVNRASLDLGSSAESLYSLTPSPQPQNLAAPNPVPVPPGQNLGLMAQNNRGSLMTPFFESPASVQSNSKSTPSSFGGIPRQLPLSAQQNPLFVPERPNTTTGYMSGIEEDHGHGTMSEEDEMSGNYDTTHMSNVVSQLVSELDLQ